MRVGCADLTDPVCLRIPEFGPAIAVLAFRPCGHVKRMIRIRKQLERRAVAELFAKRLQVALPRFVGQALGQFPALAQTRNPVFAGALAKDKIPFSDVTPR